MKYSLRLCTIFHVLLYTSAWKAKLRMAVIVICACLMFPLVGSGFAAPVNRVKNIRLESGPARETAVVYLKQHSDLSHFVLHSPERIVVDMKDVVVPLVNVEQTANGTLINKIRAGQNTRTRARIVLDMNENIPYEFSVSQQSIEGRHIVKIDTFTSSNAVESLPAAAMQKIDKIGDGSTSEDLNSSSDIALLDGGLLDDVFAESVYEKQISDFAISGEIQTRGTIQAKDDPEIENKTSLRNRVLIETSYRDNITLSALSDYLYFGNDNRTDEYDLTLHEAKWSYTGKKAGVFLGKQIRRWGKTDQFSPVDTLNPQDMREFILPDYEERKIPVWMGGVNLFFDHFTLEGVVIPFFQESSFDYFQTNWAIFRHMKKEIQNASVPLGLKSYFSNMAVHEQKPANESEWGLRLTSTISDIDFGFTFHRTIEDNPHFNSFPVKNIRINGNMDANDLTNAVFTNEDIEVEYKRANIAGFEFETISGGFGLRGEAAWQSDESFITSSFTSVRKPTLIYIIGADHTTDKDIYFNFQFAHKFISDYDPSILYFDKNTYSLLGEISTDIVSDWLEAALDYSFTLNDGSWFISPHLTYTYITNLKVILGVFIFTGDDTTWIGRFKNNDFIFMDMSYQF